MTVMRHSKRLPLLLSLQVYLIFSSISLTECNEKVKEDLELNFNHPGINYIPLHGVCVVDYEEKVDYILRTPSNPSESKVQNVVNEYFKHRKAKPEEICDFTKGLSCHHRVIHVKEDVDVKTLILRQQNDVDPDGGGSVISGLANIERALKEDGQLQVLSTCRCSPVDAQEFAGECLVRAGLPCKFQSMFTQRKCVQNAACEGGIDDLEAEYEGLNSWQSYYKLTKYAAVRTCQCNFGFTRTSGRECLRNDGTVLGSTFIGISFFFAAATTFVKYFVPFD